MKPRIIYVDDEPKNISIFELMFDEEMDIFSYDNAFEALKSIKEKDPWVIVSDQMMPGMTGLELLELAEQLAPQIPRIVITGQTDEKTMIKLVRFARLFDYIPKPMDGDAVVTSINKAVQYSLKQRELAKVQKERDELTASLLKKNAEYENQLRMLEIARYNEKKMLAEAEAWSSPAILNAMYNENIKFPLSADLVCITYDIINSSKLHGVVVEGINLHSYVLNIFTSCLLQYDGIQECHGGDGAFGHFGAFSYKDNAASIAFAVAQKFRVALRNLTRIHNIEVECGISIHTARTATILIHEVSVETGSRTAKKKFLSSISPEIDMLFRMEKLVHNLPGSNIIMSKDVVDKLTVEAGLTPLGRIFLKGQENSIELFIVKSYQVNDGILDRFIADNFVVDSVPVFAKIA